MPHWILLYCCCGYLLDGCDCNKYAVELCTESHNQVVELYVAVRYVSIYLSIPGSAVRCIVGYHKNNNARMGV